MYVAGNNLLTWSFYRTLAPQTTQTPFYNLVLDGHPPLELKPTTLTQEVPYIARSLGNTMLSPRELGQRHLRGAKLMVIEEPAQSMNTSRRAPGVRSVNRKRVARLIAMQPCLMDAATQAIGPP